MSYLLAIGHGADARIARGEEHELGAGEVEPHRFERREDAVVLSLGELVRARQHEPGTQQRILA